MKMRKVVPRVVAILLFVAAGPCFAGPLDNDAYKCSTVYENHNQLDYGPLTVSAVRGTGVIHVGNQEQPVASGACFVLFSEKDRVLVASVVAGTDGHFTMKDIPPGRYRLIARAQGLCAANIPLEIVESAPKNLEIRVNFRPTGMDTCSNGELLPPEGHGPKNATRNRPPN